MANQAWTSPVPPFATADASLTNSAALTDVAASSTCPQLAAFQLAVGTEIEIEADGNLSTTGTPTLLLGFYYGGIAAALPLAASTAITTGSGAASWPFRMRYRGVIRAVGTTGSINGQGELLLGTALTTFSLRPIPETAAARTVTIDTTTAKSITLGAQWGTASASNTLVLNDISVRLAN